MHFATLRRPESLLPWQGHTCVVCAHTCVDCAHTCVDCAYTCVISAKSFLVCARIPASCLPRASSRLHRKSFLVCARIPASCLPRASSRLHRKRFLGDLAARNERSLHGRIRDRPFFNKAGVTRILPCSELSLRAARSPRNLFLCRREEALGRHDAGIRAQTRKLFAEMTQVYAQSTQVCAQSTQVCAQTTQVCPCRPRYHTPKDARALNLCEVKQLPVESGPSKENGFDTVFTIPQGARKENPIHDPTHHCVTAPGLDDDGNNLVFTNVGGEWRQKTRHMTERSQSSPTNICLESYSDNLPVLSNLQADPTRRGSGGLTSVSHGTAHQISKPNNHLFLISDVCKLKTRASHLMSGIGNRVY
ncbi:hypothetical protein Bbelb_154520 [Branchiostoma belcheri]|nr:hypothetical protein Bbelb_154520 [Branchiostoma belcheri]